jgi:hypothetical protein
MFRSSWLAVPITRSGAIGNAATAAMSGAATASKAENRRREAAMTDDFKSRIEKAVKREKSGTPDWASGFFR